MTLPRAARLLWSACSVLVVSCGGSSPPPTRAVTAATTLAPAAIARLTAPLHVRDVGFETPESVLHDPEADLYLVSNIAGGALQGDDRGFISQVRPDGTIANLKWIDASAPEVELHAPKGMALAARVLYVADIDCVRKFDRQSGRPLGAIAIAGASFLHDLALDADGSLYVSDSGIALGLTPNGRDAIYRVNKQGLVERLADGAELGQPSGLSASEGSVTVVSFGSGELYRLDARGQRGSVERLAKGTLDGIAEFEQRVFVSSWEGAAVYERTAEGFVERIGQLRAPADLAFDARRRRLLVTHYDDNALSIHQL